MRYRGAAKLPPIILRGLRFIKRPCLELTTKLSTGMSGFELAGFHAWHIFYATVLYSLIYLYAKKYMLLNYGTLFAPLLNMHNAKYST